MKIKLTDIPCFYINMDKSPKRSENTRRILETLGFKSITRISGVEADNPAYGCAMSHLSILENAPGYPFIIFEDDIDTKNFMEEIDIPDNADALYLGNHMHNANSIYADVGDMYTMLTNKRYPPLEDVRSFDQIYRVRDMLATHAILYISKDFVASAAKLIKSGLHASRVVPLDVTLAKMQFHNNVYVVKDPMFWQNDPRAMVSKITTIFPTYEIKNILQHYPNNYEFITFLAQQEINKFEDRMML